MMSKKVTIYDIAREAGVSTATVTRVFRHDPHVSEATRIKVQQIIDAHDYTPSLSAQNLEGGRTRTLALVLPVVSNLYFNRIFDAAYWEAEKNGCSVRLFQTMENQAISPEIVNELIRCRMDGVLFAGSIWSADRDDLNVALERLGKYMPVATICPDDVSLECICSSPHPGAPAHRLPRRLHAQPGYLPPGRRLPGAAPSDGPAG